jgi:hypothetical protein
MLTVFVLFSYLSWPFVSCFIFLYYYYLFVGCVCMFQRFLLFLTKYIECVDFSGLYG